MSQKVSIKYLDGRDLEVTIGPRAEVEVERRFNVSFVDAFNAKNGTPKFDHFYTAAWAAVHYSGQEPDDYDTWLAKIADVDFVKDDEGEETGPTRPGRRPAKSSD